MDEILEVVRASLSTPPLHSQLSQAQSPEKLEYPEDEWDESPADEFDDTGHGAGVEGDLEMGDDD